MKNHHSEPTAAPTPEPVPEASALSRRALLKRTGIVAAGVMLGPALVQAATAPAGNAAAPGDLEILNFALGMEHFEQAFYTRVVEADTQRQFLHGRLHETVPLLRDNEAAHVEAITTAITGMGGTPVAPATYHFPPEVLISPLAYARFAYTIEEIGIGAYLGAIGKIRSREVRRAAAAIYGNEARHAALLRHLGGFQFSPRYYEGPLTMEQTQQLIAPYVG